MLTLNTTEVTEIEKALKVAQTTLKLGANGDTEYEVGLIEDALKLLKYQSGEEKIGEAIERKIMGSEKVYYLSVLYIKSKPANMIEDELRQLANTAKLKKDMLFVISKKASIEIDKTADLVKLYKYEGLLGGTVKLFGVPVIIKDYNSYEPSIIDLKQYLGYGFK